MVNGAKLIVPYPFWQHIQNLLIPAAAGSLHECFLSDNELSSLFLEMCHFANKH